MPQRKRKKPTFRPLSASRVARGVALVEKAAHVVGVTPMAASGERPRRTRVRVGAQQAAGVLSQMVTDFGVDLPGVNTADMVALLEHGARLRRLLNAIEILRRNVKDEIARAEGNGWQMARAAHTALAGAARCTPVIEPGLVRVAPWFTNRRRNGRGIDPRATVRTAGAAPDHPLI